MSVALPDANVLIALMWPVHEDHDPAQEWFSRNAHPQEGSTRGHGSGDDSFVGI
jgi:predicted nucleic acid-binding protein